MSDFQIYLSKVINLYVKVIIYYDYSLTQSATQSLGVEVGVTGPSFCEPRALRYVRTALPFPELGLMSRKVVVMKMSVAHY